MPEPGKHTFIPKPIHPRDAAADGTNGSNEAVVCERCGAEMFRMHAVWRCPKCRFKTDCCGW